uniref:glucose-6-phosphate 1-epimerase n=1 Tax=Schizaphis graminum TaxID=13262 RepID=A0A2S2NHD2_SCHGA
MAAIASSVVVLDRGNNTTCTINLHGATVVSWRVNNQEQLFVSKLAVFDGQKSIRGGIPIVFPHFGPWAYGPLHGFAMTCRWSVEKQPEPLDNGDIEALFSLVDNSITKQMWNYSFKLVLRVILREKELQVSFNLYNSSLEPFQFNMLFHTYLKVPDVRKCNISGLQGCMFVDKTKENSVYQEPREMVTVNHWTDRIYQNTQQEHVISNVVSGRKMKMIKYNMPDTVVWNPWDVTSSTMSDFGEDEYPNMICVEAGIVITPITLNPNNTYEGTIILQVM